MATAPGWQKTRLWSPTGTLACSGTVPSGVGWTSPADRTVLLGRVGFAAKKVCLVVSLLFVLFCHTPGESGSASFERVARCFLSNSAPCPCSYIFSIRVWLGTCKRDLAFPEEDSMNVLLWSSLDEEALPCFNLAAEDSSAGWRLTDAAS